MVEKGPNNLGNALSPPIWAMPVKNTVFLLEGVPLGTKVGTKTDQVGGWHFEQFWTLETIDQRGDWKQRPSS